MTEQNQNEDLNVAEAGDIEAATAATEEFNYTIGDAVAPEVSEDEAAEIAAPIELDGPIQTVGRRKRSIARVHLVAGLWGTVGLRLLASRRGQLTGGGGYGQKLFAIQVIVAVVAMAFSGIVTVVIALGLKVTMGWRIDEDDERGGVDDAEHRETAYDGSTAIPVTLTR